MIRKTLGLLLAAAVTLGFAQVPHAIFYEYPDILVDWNKVTALQQFTLTNHLQAEMKAA